MKTIDLTKGFKAKICDCHYETVAKFNWHYHPSHQKTGYAARTVNKSSGVSKSHKVLMHQMIMQTKDGYTVDHINQDSLDNRCSNLRYATASQQMANRTQINSSEYRGSYFHKRLRKWQAQIRVNGTCLTLGTFDNALDAARAYNKAAAKHFGEFAVLNKGVEL
jgi:hypothetical protein